jgi:hypothetical protein
MTTTNQKRTAETEETDVESGLVTDLAVEFGLGVGDRLHDARTEEILVVDGDHVEDDLTSTDVIEVSVPNRTGNLDSTREIDEHAFRARVGSRYFDLDQSVAEVWGVADLVDAAAGRWELVLVAEKKATYRYESGARITVGERFHADTQTGAWGVSYAAPDEYRSTNVARTDSRRAALALARAMMTDCDGSEPVSLDHFRGSGRSINHYGGLNYGSVVVYRAAGGTHRGEVVVDVTKEGSAAQVRRFGCESRVHDMVRVDEIETLLSRL